MLVLEKDIESFMASRERYKYPTSECLKNRARNERVFIRHSRVGDLFLTRDALKDSVSLFSRFSLHAHLSFTCEQGEIRFCLHPSSVVDKPRI